MTGWIIFGGILAGIAALCLTNIRLDAFYRNGEMGAEARWLFVRYRIWPRPEKKKKAEKTYMCLTQNQLPLVRR